MRAVREVIADNWPWFVAVYLGSLALALAFGWPGFCIAFVLAFALQHCTRAYSKCNPVGLHLVEHWYFKDDVRDQTVDADDAGRGV